MAQSVLEVQLGYFPATQRVEATVRRVPRHRHNALKDLIAPEEALCRYPATPPLAGGN